MLQLKLKKGKEKSVQRFHPWLFSGAFEQISLNIDDGSLVEVVNNNNNFVAVGHFHHGSIAVRILSFLPVTINQQFWNTKISEAYNLRLKLGLHNKLNNIFRLIHGEGDGLPGLIIEIYGKTAVIQCHTLGMLKSLPEITSALKTVLHKNLKAIYNKSKNTIPNYTPNLPADGFLFGLNEVKAAIENNHVFEIDFLEGQKTGFFIDQRENRKLLAQLAFNKTVLNTFCYTGGFTIYALLAGATLVHSVDSSSKAIEVLEKNIALNKEFKGKHQAFIMDTYQYLNSQPLNFDIVILDPPAYAKHQKAVNNALKGYRKINQKAIEKMKPGSLLFTFSCSQAVDLQNFKTAIFSAATLAKKSVKVLQTLHQPADHPVSLFHPEGEYLKGLLLEIGDKI